MYSTFRKSVLASSIALALATASGAAIAGDTADDITEARQESQIWTTYSLSPYLRANGLEVSVDDGKATLTGTVEESVNKELAEEIAASVTGIDSVDNQIKVAADYAPKARTSQERNFGEVVDDATITATVKSKLLWSKSTEGLKMDVDTRMGKVTLNGAAQSDAARKLAGNMAANTRGVSAVENRLVVDTSNPASKPVAESSAQADAPGVSDGWITTKVNSTFMYSTNVEAHNIDVSTDKGIVTLTGKVDSGAERALAIELASNIRGVKSVNAKALTI